MIAKDMALSGPLSPVGAITVVHGLALWVLQTKPLAQRWNREPTLIQVFVAIAGLL